MDDALPAPTVDTADRTLRTVVAAACGGAAAIHFAFTADHLADSTAHGAFFLGVAWLQVAIALAIGVGRRPGRVVLLAGAAVNLGVIAVWIVSRTAGISGEVEPVAFPDTLATALEGIVVLGAVALAASWLTRVAIREVQAGAWIGASAVAVAALVTASITPALGGAHQHIHGVTDEHGQAVAAQPAAAKTQLAAGEHDHHGATSATPAAPASKPASAAAGDWTNVRETALLGGLSSKELADRTAANRAYLLAQLRSRSKLLKSLPKAEADARIDAFVDWQIDNVLKVEHGGGTGHGNHTSGPMVWKPLSRTDAPKLQAELKAAGTVITRFPTAADAVKGGYFQVTPWVPGIGAHYLNVSLTDGTFDPTKPEMLLYNGNEPSAELVGVSYSVLGSKAPAGFTGDNDSWHVHPSLCIVGAFVVGSDATAEDLCASVGGRKGNAFGKSQLFMMHLWQVPGWESYWGLFSGESPAINMASSDVGKV